jgi:hypothetical protein
MRTRYRVSKISFYINYSLTLPYLDGIRHYQAGPFNSYEEANQNRPAFLGFEGVSDVWIGEKRDKSRRLSWGDLDPEIVNAVTSRNR